MAVKEYEITGKTSGTPTDQNVAVICGVTGLVGNELAGKLLSTPGWKVYGIARQQERVRSIQNPNYHFISCNLFDPLETQEKLCGLEDATHMFWITWASQFALDSLECCEQNKAMMNNVLDVLLPRAKGLKHVSLQTGTKHYVSLQLPYGDMKEDRYYDEECPRTSNGNNFYYVLEDLLKLRLRGKVPWSVHRPGLLMGCSRRTLFNFIGSLCVYGTICRHLNMPFVFGGTRECWEEMFIDASDARLVAEQHIWAATHEGIHSVKGQAFNAINGEKYSWKEIWPSIGMKLGVHVPENAFSEEFKFSTVMANKMGIWEEIAVKEGLVRTKMEDLANWGFMDVLFRCPVKMLVTREKVDRLGFRKRYQTLDSIMYWVDVMRKEKLIP